MFLWQKRNTLYYLWKYCICHIQCQTRNHQQQHSSPANDRPTRKWVLHMDLMRYYSDIIEKYPTYVTQTELCEICKICAKWPPTIWNKGGEISYTVEQNRLIRTHKIKLTDILEYLYKKECRQELDSPYICAMKEFYERRLIPYPDLLSVKDVQKVTGFSSSAVVGWISRNILKAFQPGKGYVIPKWLFCRIFDNPYYRQHKK